MTDEQDRLMPASEVKKFFGGVSDMWLHRRVNEEGSTFPRPIYIARLRYWRRSEIEAYVKSKQQAA